MNDNPKTNPKNGLPIAFLKLYFSPQFFYSSIGWSDYEGIHFYSILC